MDPIRDILHLAGLEVVPSRSRGKNRGLDFSPAFEDLTVAEPQYPIAANTQQGVALPILLESIGVELPSVKLDDKPLSQQRVHPAHARNTDLLPEPESESAKPKQRDGFCDRLSHTIPFTEQVTQSGWEGLDATPPLEQTYLARSEGGVCRRDHLLRALTARHGEQAAEHRLGQPRAAACRSAPVNDRVGPGYFSQAHRRIDLASQARVVPWYADMGAGESSHLEAMEPSGSYASEASTDPHCSDDGFWRVWQAVPALPDAEETSSPGGVGQHPP